MSGKIDALFDELRDAVDAKTAWRAISAAPRDTSYVLLWWPALSLTPVIGCRSFNGKQWLLDFKRASDIPGPTHWMPLPEPPQ